VDTGDPLVGILSVHTYTSVTGEGRYDIAYFDLPAKLTADPNAAQGLLYGIRNGWLKQIQGTLIEERAISLGDHPGGEAIVEAKDNDTAVMMKTRYYLAQNRFYQVMVGIPKDGRSLRRWRHFCNRWRY